MKKLARNILGSFGYSVHRVPEDKDNFERIYDVFNEYTMVPKELFLDNLTLAKSVMDIEGDIVECGVWKGGMIAGLSQVLGDRRTYHLFDSFQGLPDAKPIDGEKAIAWQKRVDSVDYFDNCSASSDFAKKAMKRAGVNCALHVGWFDQTVPRFVRENKVKVALLRLDGDWYDSTWCCIEHLFPLLSEHGLIIIDDYYAWDGCSRAVHDYLSKIKSVSRVRSSANGVAYIVKQD